MSKLVKLFAMTALLAGALALTPGPAAAQRHHGGPIGAWHGGWHGGAWRGGAWHGGWRGRWSGAWGWPGPFFGWGAYYEPYFYAGPDCGWDYVRVLRGRHWVLRRVWQCW